MLTVVALLTALTVAAAFRRSDEYFEDWAEDAYNSAPPPYSSRDSENWDNDEEVLIWIESTTGRAIARQKATAAAANELAAARKTAAPSADSASRPIGVTFDTEASYTADPNVFARNPAPAVLGGLPSPPSAFPDGFVHLMERLSWMCYSVAAYCSESAPKGALYTYSEISGKSRPQAVWIAPEGWSVGCVPNLVDTVHTDLIDPSDGTKLVSDEQLIAGTSTSTTTVFVNGGSVTAAGVAAAINKCDRLECVVLLECVVSRAVLTASSLCDSRLIYVICA